MYNFIPYFISTDKSESNMKLLVTGGLGFIGSNFIIKLLKATPSIYRQNLELNRYQDYIQSYN